MSHTLAMKDYMIPFIASVLHFLTDMAIPFKLSVIASKRSERGNLIHYTLLFPNSLKAVTPH
ncbi:hypothetical protein KAT73_03715, partial [candidate division WOR-3 bacterium]|nr:hypothetical protein [candidate division WOR-3 bacterium]